MMINQIDEPGKNKIMDGYKPLIKEIFEEGKEEGKEEGREEGREEGLSIGVIKLYHQGFSKGQITEIFDLSPEKVEEILSRSEEKE